MNKFKSIASWTLVVVACLMISAYGMVRWTEQQFLDTNNWVATVSTLPKDQAVADSIGKQIVDKMFESSDLTNNLQSVLPPRLVFLAPTISGFLHTKADELASKIIMSDKFTTLWSEANRRAHQKLVDTLRAPQSQANLGKALPYKIDLGQAQQWLEAAADKSDNAGLIRASDAVGRVETFNASLRSGLAQARAVVHYSDALYALLPYAILAALLGALTLARNRFKALLGICIGVTGLSVLAIVGVNLLRPALLNNLENQLYKPIFASLWSSLLPPFLAFARSLVVLSFLVGVLALAWHKGVFSVMIPGGVRKLKYYKATVGFVHNSRLWVARSSNYLYGAAAAVAVAYMAFSPNVTSQSVTKSVFLFLAFVSLVPIVGLKSKNK